MCLAWGICGIAGCSLSPDATQGHANDPVYGGQIGGHPNTVIVDFSGLDLLKWTGTSHDLTSDNFVTRQMACTGMLVAPNLVLTAGHCLLPLVFMYALPDQLVRFYNLTTAQLDHYFAWKDLVIYRNPHVDIAFIQLPEQLVMPKPVSLRLDSSAAKDVEVHMDGHVRYDADGTRFEEDIVTTKIFLSKWRYWDTLSGYNAYWSWEYPSLGQPGDSGGPVYTLQDDGSAHVYGVLSAVLGPTTPENVLERCSGTLDAPWACQTIVADFRLVSEWVAGVQGCADRSQCVPGVLSTQTQGSGTEAHLFSAQCPEWFVPVGSFSVQFSAAQRRSHIVSTSVPKKYIMRIEPTDFELEEVGLVATVTADFSEGQVQSVVYPNMLQITDARIKYECVERRVIPYE